MCGIMSTMNTPPQSNAPTVAILGASGIGRNHARWFWKHGCRVSCFLGSSPESVRRTEEALRVGFPFQGRGYHDLHQLLEAEQPSIVCISTPPAQHEAQVQAALEAGAHVLCEKPLLFDGGRDPKYLQARGEELIALASEKNLVFGTQMQYAAVVDELQQGAGHTGVVRQFGMEMETKNIKENREGAQIWIDLSPHPLSILQVLAGEGARLDEGSIECRVAKHETHARFRIAKADGATIEASIGVRFDPEANPPRRCFRFDDKVVELAGYREPDGEFRALLTREDGHKTLRDDFVDTLVGNFLAAVRGEEALRVTAAMGVQNVAWQHAILAASHT